MSVTNNNTYRNHVFECDGVGCHKTIETETSNWESAQNILHRNKWRARFFNREWGHYCPALRNRYISGVNGASPEA